MCYCYFTFPQLMLAPSLVVWSSQSQYPQLASTTGAGAGHADRACCSQAPSEPMALLDTKLCTGEWMAFFKHLLNLFEIKYHL